MALKVGTPLPSLDGALHWFNSEPSPRELQGHFTIVHFWSISCPACLLHLGDLEKWQAENQRLGLKFVSIHLPKGANDGRLETVETVVKKYGVTIPCAMDSNSVIGDRFQFNGIWPSYFLFDKEGKMRCRAAGSVGFNLVSATLLRLYNSSNNIEQQGQKFPCLK